MRFTLDLVDEQRQPTAANDITGLGGYGFSQFTLEIAYTGLTTDVELGSQITVGWIPSIQAHRVTSNKVYVIEETERRLLTRSESVE